MLYTARVSASTSQTLPDSAAPPGARERNYLIQATGPRAAEVAASQLALADLALEGLKPAGALEVDLNRRG